MPVREALDIVRQTAEGLAVAWRKRITHLDIKPQNLMVDAGGFVRIMDFGLATTAEDLELSDTGFLGKPHYVSPEQIESEEPDVRADMYSLGAVLYEMLTGRILFDGDSPLEIADKHLRDSVPPVRTYRPDIPPLVEQLVAKCLEKKPADRFKSPRGLVQAIDKVMSTLPPEEELVPPPSPVGAYVAVLQSASGREYLVPADKQLVSIGRKSKEGTPDVDLSMEDPKRHVSRRHAKISRKGDQWFITLYPKVRGPSYVNKRKLTPGKRVPLKDGDKLRLSRVELTFRVRSG
jgi:serine/threonine protein kinase